MNEEVQIQFKEGKVNKGIRDFWSVMTKEQSLAWVKANPEKATLLLAILKGKTVTMKIIKVED